jgi:UDP-N-acetyl-D-glucosamine dehydrogenase
MGSNGSHADRRVAVIGLGYVGLPLAVAFVEAGLDVLGVDAVADRVKALRDGVSHVDDVSNERLGAAVATGLSIDHVDDANLRTADAVFVCVPTPLDQAKNPDLSLVIAAARMIRAFLHPGQLIVLQSTTYPGTTRGPFREELERDGVLAGLDFDLAYAPERVNPGDPASAARTVPRLVGGIDEQSTRRAAALLRRINDYVRELSSPDAAELAKLHENVFRNVNIALANELALLCERMGLDVWEVIDAASTKPFGFMRFTPGPGVGGHCIPVDPYYLSWRARQFEFVDRFVELAGDINLAMPRHVVDLVAVALNERRRPINGSRVGLLGVAFKRDVRDPRNSPAAEILPLLLERGAIVEFHDPNVDDFRDARGAWHRSQSIERILDADVVVVVTPHGGIDWDRVIERADLLVDTVDISRGRVGRERQVLRLGAGWATPDRPRVAGAAVSTEAPSEQPVAARRSGLLEQPST